MQQMAAIRTWVAAAVLISSYLVAPATWPLPLQRWNLGYPPLKSATSLQPASLLIKTQNQFATSPQQLRNSATSLQTGF